MFTKLLPARDNFPSWTLLRTSIPMRRQCLGLAAIFFCKRRHQAGMNVRGDGLGFQTLVHLNRALRRVQDHPTVRALFHVFMKRGPNVRVQSIVQKVA